MGTCSSSRRESAVLDLSAIDPLLLSISDDNSIFRELNSHASGVALNRGSRMRRRREQRLNDEARMAEIIALQQSLAAMEDFFQSLLGQAQLHYIEQAFDPQNGGNQGPPPASRTLTLPKVDSPPNATCGICSELLAKRATQMPCGHLFHATGCIDPWLQRHCTCPVCRYEVKTDDASYESDRILRMSSRKLPTLLEPECAEPPSTRHQEIIFDPVEGNRMEQDWSNNEYSANDADDSSEHDEGQETAEPFPKSNQVSHYDADESSMDTLEFVENKDRHESGNGTIDEMISTDESENMSEEEEVVELGGIVMVPSF